MSHSLRTLAAFGAIAALSLTACATDDDAVRHQGAEPVPDTLASFYDQDMDWDICDTRDDYECGTVEVPMDYANPSNDSIEIHLTRAIANADQQPMLFNPGGPGSSGITFVQQQLDTILSDRLAGQISAVGFDPRGVGASEPIRCMTDAEFDESRETSIDASTPEGWAASEADMKQFGEQCLERSGDIVKFADTVSAAKDMDVIRSALGQPVLDYFGTSYGTKLGATYAELFPKNVGKFVLDSVLPPSAETFEVTKAQSAGFEQALHTWAQWCAETSECHVGTPGDAASVMAAVTQFLQDVEAEPLVYPDGRVQPVSDLFFGVVTPLYSRDSWDYLAWALEQGIARNFEASDQIPIFLFLADAYHGRNEHGQYTNNTDAFHAINCLDSGAEEKTPEQARIQAEELAANAPLFGPFMSYSTGCNGWPVESAEPLGPTVAEGSDTIVVTNLTGDPATPMHFSHALADQLDNSVHITVEGEGHGAYSRENDCIVEAIDGYILDDELPEDGLVCQ